MRKGFKRNELSEIHTALLACGMIPPVNTIDVWFDINPDHPLDKKFDLYKMRFQKGDKYKIIAAPATTKWDIDKVKEVLIKYFGGEE